MTTPHRIRLSRAKGWRMPENTVKVDRSTVWGNPYRVVQAHFNRGVEKGKTEWWVESDSMVWRFDHRIEAIEASVQLFRASRTENFKERARLALRGKNLACWCALDAPCDADVLLQIANGPICEALP